MQVQNNTNRRVSIMECAFITQPLCSDRTSRIRMRILTHNAPLVHIVLFVFTLYHNNAMPKRTNAYRYILDWRFEALWNYLWPLFNGLIQSPMNVIVVAVAVVFECECTVHMCMRTVQEHIYAQWVYTIGNVRHVVRVSRTLGVAVCRFQRNEYKCLRRGEPRQNIGPPVAYTNTNTTYTPFGAQMPLHQPPPVGGFGVAESSLLEAYNQQPCTISYNRLIAWA